MTEQTGERRLKREELVATLEKLDLRGELLVSVIEGLNTAGYPRHVVLEAALGLSGSESPIVETETKSN